MNKRGKIIIYILIALLPLALFLFQSIYLRSSIVSAYAGEPDPFIKFIVDLLYPRFNIEKERFDLTFFLDKSDQVIYRFSIVYYLLFILFYFYKTNNIVAKKINDFFYTETNSKNIAVLRIIFFSYFFYFSYEIIDELIAKQSLSLFYKPVYLLSLFHIPFPSYYALLVVGVIWYFLNLLLVLNVRVIFCSVLSLIIFLLVQCWSFSFEKVDHGYATITYVFLLIPFLFDEERKNVPLFNSWSLQLIRISIALVYFMSGLEKIIVSQFSWVKADSLKFYLSFHETKLSSLIIQNNFLCTVLSSGALMFQLSFILILFFPRWKWVWIIGGVLFHTSTLILMNIGILFNPWILVYIFFFDWTKIYDFFFERLKKSSIFSS
jgi:hypothetical protein